MNEVDSFKLQQLEMIENQMRAKVEDQNPDSKHAAVIAIRWVVDIIAQQRLELMESIEE